MSKQRVMEGEVQERTMSLRCSDVAADMLDYQITSLGLNPEMGDQCTTHPAVHPP